MACKSKTMANTSPTESPIHKKDCASPVSKHSKHRHKVIRASPQDPNAGASRNIPLIKFSSHRGSKHHINDPLDIESPHSQSPFFRTSYQQDFYSKKITKSQELVNLNTLRRTNLEKKLDAFSTYQVICYDIFRLILFPTL